MKVKSLDEHIEHAINGQLQLNTEAVKLSAQWPTFTPQEIAERCERLNVLREETSDADNDLVEILNLAGPESADHPRLVVYKSLLENTILVFDQISLKANNHKAMLQRELARLKKSRVGLAGYSSQTQVSGGIVKNSY